MSRGRPHPPKRPVAALAAARAVQDGLSGPDPLLASISDGVGTKIAVARARPGWSAATDRSQQPGGRHRPDARPGSAARG